MREPKDLSFTDFAHEVCEHAPQWQKGVSVSATNPDICPIPLSIPQEIWEETLTFANANKYIS
jgi:hypothetical protein